MWMGDGWGAGWGVGMLFMMLFWVAVLAALVLLIRAFFEPRVRIAGGPTDDSPLDILKKRFARGEIDHDEFEKRKRDLS